MAIKMLFHTLQSPANLPRTGSLISMSANLNENVTSNLGGTFGGPPDCVKTSYGPLHLTSEELQTLARYLISIFPKRYSFVTEIFTNFYLFTYLLC